MLLSGSDPVFVQGNNDTADDADEKLSVLDLCVLVPACVLMHSAVQHMHSQLSVAPVAAGTAPGCACPFLLIIILQTRHSVTCLFFCSVG